MKWKLLFFVICLALGNTPSAVIAGIFEGNHPAVEKGHQAFNGGKYEDALKAYQQAEKELPKSPEIKFNIGNAYMNLGQLEEAKRAYESALSNAGKELKAKDYYNLGNAFAALQQDNNAVSAYRQALKADPQLEPARHNLEVMLRKQEQPPESKKQPSPDKSESEQSSSDSSSDSDNDKQPNEKNSSSENESSATEKKPDQLNQPDQPGQNKTSPDQPSAEAENQPAPKDAPPNDNSNPANKEAPAPGNPSSEPIDRREAQRLLEAIRRNEKQFLMPQRNRKVTPRVPPEKDW